MKKILIFLGLLIPIYTFGQTGGNTGGNTNTSGNTGSGQNNTTSPTNQNSNSNPVFQNPYNSNPYNQNPFLDPSQQNSNFFNNQQKGNNNQQQGQQQEQLQGTKNIDPKNFQDINNLKELNENQKLEELYKNDPDYLKYLGSKNKVESEDPNQKNKDSLNEIKVGKKQVYGANFFENNVFDLSDKTPTAPPVDYRLGPGDEVIVSLWGNAELQQNYVLGKDGSIFPRLVGKIYLQGMTFDAASRLISSKFKKIIPQNTSIDVQMGKSRTIKVTILGEVKKQGTYTISGFNTAINALYRAGGLTEIGNMRSIEIKREGRTVEIIDLYKYLQKGKNAEEVYLEDNDYIYVDVYEKLVNAEGEFKRPMYYQLKGDEGLRDLVEYSGGPSSNARNSLIHIKTISNEMEKYIDIPGREYFNTYNSNSYSELILKDGDVVTLKPINTGLKNVVKIEGAINYPDEYEVREGEKLNKVLERAGGIASTAYMPRAFVYRGTNPIETKTIKIDLRDYENDPNQNIEILAGDRINILSNKDFEQDYFIEVIGNVRTPKKIKYSKNIRLKDALLMSGGLSLDAENGHIEISNIVDSVDKYNIKSKGSNVKIVSINSNLEIDETSENIILKPLDRVYVRRKIEFLKLEKVQVLGEVNYAGEYALIERGERLSSILKRTGGLKKTAYPQGAKLIRQNIGQVVIDLPSVLGNNTKSGQTKSKQFDFALEDGDILIVPTLNDIVSVKGEVQSEINIKYDKNFNNVEYYISTAGGYGDDPWKKRINIKYQNGKIKSTKHILFFNKYPKVKEGCTVFVPKKPKRENKTKFSEIFSYSLSAITSLATLLVLSKSLSK